MVLIGDSSSGSVVAVVIVASSTKTFEFKKIYLKKIWIVLRQIRLQDFLVKSLTFSNSSLRKIPLLLHDDL